MGLKDKGLTGASGQNILVSLCFELPLCDILHVVNFKLLAHEDQSTA